MKGKFKIVWFVFLVFGIGVLLRTTIAFASEFPSTEIRVSFCASMEKTEKIQPVILREEKLSSDDPETYPTIRDKNYPTTGDAIDQISILLGVFCILLTIIIKKYQMLSKKIKREVDKQ
ncbi:hypothetical protein [Enterococcus sp. AZ072]|uniref:hypothetical protein n=1 Tax=unclassified Enterococcus TaxID=2608891 RepID=UPI003D279BF8